MQRARHGLNRGGILTSTHFYSPRPAACCLLPTHGSRSWPFTANQAGETNAMRKVELVGLLGSFKELGVQVFAVQSSLSFPFPIGPCGNPVKIDLRTSSKALTGVDFANVGPVGYAVGCTGTEGACTSYDDHYCCTVRCQRSVSER